VHERRLNHDSGFVRKETLRSVGCSSDAYLFGIAREVISELIPIGTCANGTQC